jgi:hypothetical protein
MSALTRWNRLWRREPIDITSALPLCEVEQRAAERATRQGLRLTYSLSLGSGPRVVGELSQARVRLHVVYPGSRQNGLAPAVRGRLVPDGPRSRLIGTIGPRTGARVFGHVWLGGACLAFVGGLVATVVSAAAGHLERAPWPAVLIPGAMVAFGVVAMSSGLRAGRREGDILRGWLEETCGADCRVHAVPRPLRRRQPESR